MNNSSEYLLSGGATNAASADALAAKFADLRDHANRDQQLLSSLRSLGIDRRSADLLADMISDRWGCASA